MRDWIRRHPWIWLVVLVLLFLVLDAIFIWISTANAPVRVDG